MRANDLKLFITDSEKNIVEAMELIDKNGEGIIFVVDNEGMLCGSVSDGDIRRWLIKTGDLSANIKKAMTGNPRFLYEDDKSKAASVMKQEVITAIPIVNSDKSIAEIVLLSDIGVEKQSKGSLRGVPIVIMAGGRGTRLYPYTKILPKPLIPIGEIPIIERIIESFCTYGAEKFYMTLNYKKAMIKSYFQEFRHDYSLCYIEEDKPLGTAGSLKLIHDLPDKPMLVTNCDILIVADYTDIYDFHVNAGNDITIVSALKNMTIPYGVLNTGDNGELISIKEKPRNSYLINTGMYILDPKLIDMIPNETEYHMTNLIDDVVRRHGKVGMYPISEESFLDMGEFSEMKRMEDKLNVVLE